jgi:hypothetical protein
MEQNHIFWSKFDQDGHIMQSLNRAPGYEIAAALSYSTNVLFFSNTYKLSSVTYFLRLLLNQS